MIRTARHHIDVAVWTLGTIIVFAALAAVIGAYLAGQDVEGARGAIVIVAVMLLSLIVFHHTSRNDPDHVLLFRLLMVSVILKLGAVAFRLWLIVSQYGGNADAASYHAYGVQIAESLLVTGPPSSLSDYHSTALVRLLTGIFYALVGPTQVGAFVFWAWLGLLGMLFFYKAFVTAFPQSNRRFFMVLILLYPSMILWTSSLGKDALVCFCLGIMTYGLALSSRRIDIVGLLVTGLGLLGVLVVRPHIAAIAGVAMVLGVLMMPIRAGLMTPVIRLTTLLIFGVAAIFVVRMAASFINLEDLSAEGVETFIEGRQTSTEAGGAAIERGGVPTNPLTFLGGVATVLFSPFPWQAHNLQARIAALEGAVLFVLMLWKWRSIRAAISDARRNPLLLVMLVFILMFSFFFSAISNFAIIARQRAQVLPFIFVWLAYLPSTQRAGRS